MEELWVAPVGVGIEAGGSFNGTVLPAGSIWKRRVPFAAVLSNVLVYSSSTPSFYDFSTSTSAGLMIGLFKFYFLMGLVT